MTNSHDKLQSHIHDTFQYHGITCPKLHELSDCPINQASDKKVTSRIYIMKAAWIIRASLYIDFDHVYINNSFNSLFPLHVWAKCP